MSASSKGREPSKVDWSAASVVERLQSLAEPDRVPFIHRFFKTGPGEYGEGDAFLGLRVPKLRALARELRGFPVDEAVRLLQSQFHEARLLALLLLVDAYQQGDEGIRERVFRTYLENTSRINNWDLVDSSAPQIVGAHLASRERSLLRTLASSSSLWERRIAILATFQFIRAGDFADTFAIAEQLLDDPHDLIHKAVGWMLREVGKRDRMAEEAFLGRHFQHMPRTMLRYAIERFEPARRRTYLEGTIQASPGDLRRAEENSPLG